MKHQIVHFSSGSFSIRDLEVDECMHSAIGPVAEAQAVYLGPSRFRESLRLASPKPLVVYDVGLGTGANALLAFQEARAAREGLHIASFDKDLEGLQTALEHPECFPFISGFTDAIRALLERGVWATGNWVWELRHGDFRDSLLGPPADLVFYDFYSPKKNPELWSKPVFEKVRAACSPRARLLTYSAASSVRVALAEAGFYVGRGPATSLKAETTIAAIDPRDLKSPIEPDWFTRRLRPSASSSRAFPLLRQKESPSSP